MKGCSFLIFWGKIYTVKMHNSMLKLRNELYNVFYRKVAFRKEKVQICICVKK